MLLSHERPKHHTHLGCSQQRARPHDFSLASTARARTGQISRPEGSMLHGLTLVHLEPNKNLIILCTNTDDILISYTENAHHLVDEFERTLNLSYECKPRVPLDYYLGMHIVRAHRSIPTLALAKMIASESLTQKSRSGSCVLMANSFI